MAGGQPKAEHIRLDVGNFDGLLSASDLDVQTALETLDDIVTNDLNALYLQVANNLSDLNSVATARTNLGLVAGGDGDIWVEKAGDTMTGSLVINNSGAEPQMTYSHHAVSYIEAIDAIDLSASLEFRVDETVLDRYGIGNVAIEEASSAQMWVSIKETNTSPPYQELNKRAPVMMSFANSTHLYIDLGGGNYAGGSYNLNLIPVLRGGQDVSGGGGLDLIIEGGHGYVFDAIAALCSDGGDLYLRGGEGGEGASGGNTDGGNVYIAGGVGYGTGSNGVVYLNGTAILDVFVNVSGDTMTGALQIDATGTKIGVDTGYDAYIQWGELDLSAIGYGKYAELQGISNGAVGNIFAIKEGLYISGYAGDPGITLFDTNTLASVVLSFDISNGRFHMNDDFNVNGVLTANSLAIETLTVGLGVAVAMSINFNGSQDDATLRWNAATDDFEFFSGTTTAGLSLSGRLRKYGSTNMYIDFEQSAAGGSGIVYADYNGGVGGYGTYISQHFQHRATNMHDDAYMMRMSNMLNPGYMFGVKSRGSLELGSTTGTDTDISITLNGGVSGRNFVATWDESDSVLIVDNDIRMSGTIKIEFTDTAIGIYSQADSFLDLFADGAVRIGDSSAGAPTNYANFASDGELTLVGTARVWKAIELWPENVKKPPTDPPGTTTYQNMGFDAYDDTNEEQVFYIWHVPPDFATGSANVRGHFGLMVANPQSGSDEYVSMGFEYWKVPDGDVFDISGAPDGGGALDITITDGETAYTWHESGVGVCTTTGWAVGDIIVFRFFRDVDGTYSANDDYTGDALLGVYHLEFLSDKIGEAS